MISIFGDLDSQSNFPATEDELHVKGDPVDFRLSLLNILIRRSHTGESVR